ncbi:MAG TPA: hypothetical protein VJ654_00650 [Noviherbaspirillum sp.]|nr:hypothetical protein [Noviherbaspirillum sp.]
MLAWKATAEAKDRQAGSAEQVASSDAASKYTALENDWNHLMDALNCDDTDSALAKIAALQHTAHVPSKPMSEMKALQAVVRENNTLHAALELACSHLTDDQVEQVSAAMPAREAVPSKSEELPTLPKNLLDLIGEYGMARTDGLNDLDVQHRWLNLIDGIKDYAFSCLQNTSRPSKAGEWTDAEIHEHAYLHASAHIRPPDSESFYEFTHKDLVKFARAILAAQADGPVIDYGTKNATQPLIAEAARDDAIGEGLDEVDQPYAGTIVLLETIAQYGAKSFDDGNPTPMRALCLRFAAEIRADQSQIALQHAAPAQAQSEDARDDGPDLTNADIPAGSAYGSTLDQLYAAFHREPCGDTLAAIGAAIQELQAMQPDHRVDDLVALVRQLARSLSKAAPDHALPAKAMDYLQRKGLQGSPLRDDVVGAFNELKDRLQGIMRYDNVSGTYSIPAAEFLDAINIIQDAAIAKERENHEQNI